MAKQTHDDKRLFERVRDRFTASINGWCAKNRDVSFLSYDYATSKNDNGQTREHLLRSRWQDICDFVIGQGRAVAFFSEDADIVNEDMNFNYEGKKILVSGGMDGVFIPVDTLYKAAFLNQGYSDVYPIELEDFLSARDDVFPSLLHEMKPSFVIMDGGKPVMGFASPMLCLKISITQDETIKFSTGSNITPLGLAFRDVYGPVPTREFIPPAERVAEEHLYEPEVKDALFDAISEGAFRFHGSFKAKMNEKGSFQMPQEWFDVCDMDDLLMCHDQEKGELCVFFDDVLPSKSELEKAYEKVAAQAPAQHYHKVMSALSPYPWLNNFARTSSKGRVQINPTVLHDRARKDGGDNKPCEVELEGFGNGFTVRRVDDAWKHSHTKKHEDSSINVYKALSLRPIVAHVKSAQHALLRHEVELIVTTHL